MKNQPKTNKEKMSHLNKKKITRELKNRVTRKLLENKKTEDKCYKDQIYNSNTPAINF